MLPVFSEQAVLNRQFFIVKMGNMRVNVAIVLAGGVGSRMGLDKPKQFFEMGGRTILEHSVEAFEQNGEIAEVAIVSHPLYVANVETLVERNKWKKVKRILLGGKERYDSTLAALRAYAGQDVNLVFHDAVRPLVSQRIIGDVCQALREYEAVNVTLPAIDTIVEVADGRMVSTPDRSRLHRVQTPQAFRFSTIEAAYALALKDPTFKATDDCGVVFRYLPEVTIGLVLGDEKNIKMTYKEDIPVLERLLGMQNSENIIP